MCVPNETEELNLSVFNMIKGINESKVLTKHIQYECKCIFEGKKSDQWWRNAKCLCESKNCHVCEKEYIRNPSTCNYENEKYLASIMGILMITCDEIIESYHDETNFKWKKKPIKRKFYIFYIDFD